MVINELFAYLQNKILIVTEESLVKICLSCFSCEQINDSKTLLFDSLPTDYRKKIRKGQRKDNRDVTDIISLFKSVDDDVMPVFVAQDLHKLSPTTFDHLDVSKLLQDIVLLQCELKDIKSTYVTVAQSDELKSKLETLKKTIPPVLEGKISKLREEVLSSKDRHSNIVERSLNVNTEVYKGGDLLCGSHNLQGKEILKAVKTKTLITMRVEEIQHRISRCQQLRSAGRTA